LPISLHSSAVLFFTIHENVAKSRGDKIPDADLLAQFFEKRGPSGGLESNRTAHIAISARRKSPCRASRQCDIELRLCRPAKMEPERPMIDQKVLEFVKSHVFDPADFVIRTNGVCRLNPELARFVTGIAGGR
jgi:hypothetical protein